MIKHTTFCGIILFAVLFMPLLTCAKDKIADKMLSNSSQGREFFIAFPKNDVADQPDPYLEIYVTSEYDTEVTLEYSATNQITTKQIKAYEITTFSTTFHELSYDMEIFDSEIPLEMGIRLYADHPISVYAMNGKHVSSEGYLAIPVSSWGTHYIHNSWYDYALENKLGGKDRPWASGFVITAAEDKTTVTINLRGRGGNLAKTEGGREIGDIFSVTLDKGEIYMVCGDGTTRGVFDISGSEIKSTKPIGLISFCQRGTLPAKEMLLGYDHLIEMLPPVSAWGKKYISVEYARPSEKGDMFRIVALEDNTNWKVEWYDKSTGARINSKQGTIKKGGEFWEYYNDYTPRGAPGVESIRGMSVFEADKPILVMQYCYSHRWDEDRNFDPFMIIVTPEEQFTQTTVFQTPSNKEFLNNHFNIIVYQDPEDTELKDLKSVILDDIPIYQRNPQILVNHITNTDLYWAKIDVEPGVHKVTSDTKFSGYIYGFTDVDSYGWPACMNIRDLSIIDTVPPALSSTVKCGDYDYTVTELVNGDADDDPRQVDQAIEFIELSDDSYNYEIVYEEEFNAWPKKYEVPFRVQVVDKSKDAFAILQATDYYKNYSVDTLVYKADKLETIPSSMDFGKLRVNKTKEISGSLKNANDGILTITEIKFASGSDYSVSSGSIPPEISLNKGDTHDFTIKYTPLNECNDQNDFDYDTLLILTECSEFKIPVQGLAVMPKIKVADWDAGQVIVNTKVCMEEQNHLGLKLENTGSDTLIITGIKQASAPFELSQPYTPPLDIFIPPFQGEDSYVYLKSVCFTPTDTIEYKIDVLFESNAGTGDSISEWKGEGLSTGPYVTPYDWRERRVKTMNSAQVYIRNSGNISVFVNGLRLKKEKDVNFRIVSADPDPRGSRIELQPESGTQGVREIVVEVEFVPSDEAAFSNQVIPEFDIMHNIEDGSIYGTIEGIGIRPHIDAAGYEFQPPILKGTTHEDEGNVTIKSISPSADLWIEDIKFIGKKQTEFSWINTPPSKVTVNRGEELVLPLSFTPDGLLRRSVEVEITHDAADGPDEHPLVKDTVEIVGHAFEIGLIVDSLDFGHVSTCDNPVIKLKLENTSSTNDITIENIVLISGDLDLFEIDAQYPIEIATQSTIDIPVKFSPVTSGSYSATAQIYTDLGNDIKVNDYYAEFKGDGYIAPITFDMVNWTLEEQSARSMPLFPGAIAPMEIRAGSSNWKDAEFVEFEATVYYNPEYMKYNNLRKGGLLDDTWEISATEESIDPDLSRLIITGNGSTPVNADGILVIPEFVLLLKDDYIYEPGIQDISIGEKDACTDRTLLPGFIEMEYCVRDIRGLIISDQRYALHSINPNPVSEDIVSVKYDIALKGYTKIELVNSVGETIANPVNSIVDPGAYELLLQTDKLASGIYYIKMSSGPYTKTKKLIISK